MLASSRRDQTAGDARLRLGDVVEVAAAHAIGAEHHSPHAAYIKVELERLAESTRAVVDHSFVGDQLHVLLDIGGLVLISPSVPLNRRYRPDRTRSRQ